MNFVAAIYSSINDTIKEYHNEQLISSDKETIKMYDHNFDYWKYGLFDNI